jgi:hypothetical protein
VDAPLQRAEAAVQRRASGADALARELSLLPALRKAVRECTEQALDVGDAVARVEALLADRALATQSSQRADTYAARHFGAAVASPDRRSVGRVGADRLEPPPGGGAREAAAARAASAVAIAAARVAAGHEGHDVSSGGSDDDGAVAAEGAGLLGTELSAMVDSIAIVEELLAQQQAQRLAAARDEDGDDEEAEEAAAAAAAGAAVAGRTAAPARPSPIPAPISPAAPLPRAPPPLFGGDEEEDDDDDDDDDDRKQPVAALSSAMPGSSSRGEGADVAAALAALLGTTDSAGGDSSRMSSIDAGGCTMDGEAELGDLI